jgi:hypothetical protein
MLAAGNAVVFSVHPLAKACSMQTIALLNKAIVSAGGPADVVTGISNPSIESAQEVMKHPGIRLLVVTGGGAVVKAAMASGKRAICAGPGNPPVVVDETADLAKAGRDIVLGGSTDNNVICVDEKEVLVVAKVADELIRAMVAAGAVVIGKDRLGAREGDLHEDGRAARACLSRQGPHREERERHPPEDGDLRPRLREDGRRRGRPGPPAPLDGADDAGHAHLPRPERRRGHRPRGPRRGAQPAHRVMHSRNLDALSRMAKECDASIFVKNGRSQAGLGLDGEGYCSFTIASPTGEGLTGPRSFSRWRRCVLVDNFRIT